MKAAREALRPSVLANLSRRFIPLSLYPTRMYVAETSYFPPTRGAERDKRRESKRGSEIDEEGSAKRASLRVQAVRNGLSDQETKQRLFLVAVYPNVCSRGERRRRVAAVNNYRPV